MLRWKSAREKKGTTSTVGYASMLEHAIQRFNPKTSFDCAAQTTLTFRFNQLSLSLSLSLSLKACNQSINQSIDLSLRLLDNDGKSK
jgi:hypothetical protein